jgi:translin
MSNPTENLTEIGDWVRERLDAKNKARETALARSREIIRACANSIRAMHRSEFEEAKRLINEAETKHRELAAEVGGFPEIYFAGYVQDAQKEFAEACTTYAIVKGEPLPHPKELAVECAAYLNGLAEAMGEMRRQVLDVMREGDVEKAETILDLMDEVYFALVTFDYPDAVTGGLRRNTDMVRGVLERTRGDLTVAINQKTLEKALDATREALGGGKQ